MQSTGNLAKGKNTYMMYFRSMEAISLRVNDKVMHKSNDLNAVKYDYNETNYVPKRDAAGNLEMGVFNGETAVICDI